MQATTTRTYGHLRVALDRLCEQVLKRRTQLRVERIHVVAALGIHRLTDRDRDQLATRQVAVVVGQHAMAAEDDHGNQRHVSRHRHPYSAVLQVFNVERPAHGRLREDTDEFTVLQRPDRIAVSLQPLIAIDGNVVHTAHEWASDRVLENAVFSHKANKPMVDLVDWVSRERKVEERRVVHSEDRTALSGYMLTTHDVPLEPQGPEERLGGPDDGAVDGFSHALTLSAPRPTATGIH